MFAEPQTSDRTLAVYDADAIKFIGQYCRENEPDACDIDYESLVVLAVRWFLNSHGRWSKVHIRRTANALYNRVELLVNMELIDDGQRQSEKSLLWKLKNRRPEPAGKSNKRASKEKRKGYRKSVKPEELRQIIKYFRRKGDGFSHWIAGYLLIASRIGWRPGEIVVLRREGNFLRAKAEKHSNGRGLTDTCEVDISAYPQWLIARLDQWIADIGKWEEKYEGLWNLRTVMNGRLDDGHARLSAFGAYRLIRCAILRSPA